MDRITRIDPFFYKQPDTLFVEELKKPVHEKAPNNFGKRVISSGEAYCGEIYVVSEFEDEKGLLQTAYDDFERFIKVHSIGGKRYPLYIIKKETSCFEEYHLCVSEEKTVLYANDTEGIRRGLVYIEDEMLRREGAFLPLGETERKPHVRTRITRGFFSPTNRPPKCINELEDDVDYYPDEYLNRLVHDGTNGIWIYTRYSELIEDNEYHLGDDKCKKRLDKLNKVIEKCARYGIKVYAFVIEPRGFSPEMIEKYPDVTGGGVYWSDEKAFCPSTEECKNYCINSTRKLFERTNGLGGLIIITAGERVTSCASWPDAHSGCPRCSKRERAHVLSDVVDYIKEGMRQAGSDAEFISWTYEHRYWKYENIGEYVKTAPQDVMLMQNFEDAGYPEQLGKTRQAIDYWLSYPGPSELFAYTGEKTKEFGKHLYAKMQVCCSHELATVPYIPAPGIVFDKYKGAFKYGVEGVLQCWYFGNYPSLMSKAAGELSFTWDFEDKDGFLKRLAGIYFGNSKAEQAVEAWKSFEKGYRSYPVNVMFSYYGPMHDSVVWDLSLMPKNNPLSRTWLLVDVPDGDRIGECLWNGHTIDEAIELCENIKKNWGEGINSLPENTPVEQRSVANALGILFSSGLNILKFYKLREKLGMGDGDAADILEQMKAIVYEEIKHSEVMIPICQNDTRLGYHSEAEGFKFFPEKIADRIEKLKKLLQTEFVEVAERINKGIVPLMYYEGDRDGAYLIKCGEGEKVTLSNGASFDLSYDEENLYINVDMKKDSTCVICLETRLMWPMAAIMLEEKGMRLAETAFSHQQYFGDRVEAEMAKYKCTHKTDDDEAKWQICISKKDSGWDGKHAFKLRVAVDGVSWKNDGEPVITLGKDDMPPSEFGWVMCE